jgi:pyruvate dehydrogenase E2 component (dihydrolipoamide acetyltransferase)
MAIVSVRIPQIGEGLQEARLVAVLKRPGDRILRDEPIYQMETDKAVMDVESPAEGTLLEWCAELDTMLAIGAEVARIDTESATVPTPESPASPPARAQNAAEGRVIPPRTRAYAKENGLSEAELAAVPSAGTKLMPEDIDAYLGQGAPPAKHDDRPLGSRQRIMAARMVRGSQLVVPGTMTVVADWGPIERRREALKAGGGEFQPSAFTLFAFLVAQVLRDHPLFRSALVGDGATVRTYRNASLGIAVGLPGDELVLAVLDDSDTFAWPDFAHRLRERIEEARNGKDQAHEAVTLSLTNMQSFGLRDAVPVVVPPGVATLFIGEAYYGQDPNAGEPKLRRNCHLTLTFDHRLINGVGAANFLNAVKEAVENLDERLPNA